MNRDYYAETEAIAKALESDGLRSDADDLRGAVAAGATATEILMRVRWILQQIQASGKTPNPDTRRRIRDLLNGLDAVLQ